MQTCLRELERMAGQCGGCGGLRVLEIGCGRGEFTGRLHALGYHIVGMDLKPDRIAAAKERSRLKDAFIVADLTSISMADGTMDFVIANFVFEHVPDFNAGFSEVARVLRSGGAFYISVPNRWGPMEGHIPLLFPHWLPRGFLRRIYIRAFSGKDGAAWDRAIASHNYWTHKTLPRHLAQKFSTMEVRTLDRYVHGDYSGWKHRLLCAAMRLPVFNILVRRAILRFGNIEIVARVNTRD